MTGKRSGPRGRTGALATLGSAALLLAACGDDEVTPAPSVEFNTKRNGRVYVSVRANETAE